MKLRSLVNFGKVWNSLFSYTSASCSKVEQTFAIIPRDIPADLMLFGFVFEPRFAIMVFNHLLRCSMCKSHGILWPTLPIVLMVLLHFSSATFRGDKTIVCVKCLQAIVSATTLLKYRHEEMPVPDYTVSIPFSNSIMEPIP